MLVFLVQFVSCIDQFFFPYFVHGFVNVVVAFVFDDPGVHGSLCLHKFLHN